MSRIYLIDCIAEEKKKCRYGITNHKTRFDFLKNNYNIYPVEIDLKYLSNTIPSNRKIFIKNRIHALLNEPTNRQKTKLGADRLWDTRHSLYLIDRLKKIYESVNKTIDPIDAQK